jgi:hypothetical protein
VSMISESPYHVLEQETMAMVAKLRLNPLLPNLKGVTRRSRRGLWRTCTRAVLRLLRRV